MGIWATLKQRLGIGGVKLQLETPPQVGKESGQIQGRVNMISKTDQVVDILDLKIIEKYTTGRGDSEETKEFELGKTSQSGPIEIKAGQPQLIEFVLPFQPRQSVHDKLKSKGGALGALGKASSFMASEKSEFEVWVNANVKGTSLGPNDFKPINLL